MNFKIVETASQYPDVLVYRERTDDDEETVVVVAFGDNEELEDLQEYAVVEFPNAAMAKNYVKDFTVASAENFCETYNLLYPKQKV
jgi:hypothetical protein